MRQLTRNTQVSSEELGEDGRRRDRRRRATAGGENGDVEVETELRSMSSWVEEIEGIEVVM